MDLRAAGRLPQPQQQSSTYTSSSAGSISSNNPFNGTEAIRTNEANKFITFKDVYDYLSLDILGNVGGGGGGNSNSISGNGITDVDLLYPFGLANYTLDIVSGAGGGGSAAAAALNQSATLFQGVGANASMSNTWNATALWLANGSLWATATAAATTASIGGSSGGVGSGELGLSSGSVINGLNGDGGGEGEEAELGSILVTAATSIILGLMILITVIGKWKWERTENE